LVAIGVCATASATERPKVTFRGTVQEVVMLSHYSGVVRMVHFDPRYVVTIKIESASSEAPEFVVGETVVLAIHSPTQLFSIGADVRGEMFTFSVLRELEDGKPRFSLLEILKEGEPARPSNAG
jgi:hypothetical protein